MNGLDLLWWVYAVLPAAFFFDLLVLPFSIWWIRRWRRLRDATPPR
jgi:hypothetical protein